MVRGLEVEREHGESAFDGVAVGTLEKAQLGAEHCKGSGMGGR